MELTPRTGPESGDGTDAAGGDVATRSAGRPGAPSKRRLPAMILLVVVVVVGGFVVLQALGNAATFYRNVDEAVAQQDTLGTKRFRLQGTVVPGTIERTGAGVNFELAFNGVEMPVQHQGDPPEMFDESEPVLLEGHFVADGTTTYSSNLIIVKHDENYVSENEDRLHDADEGGKVPVSSTEAPSSATPNAASEASGS